MPTLYLPMTFIHIILLSRSTKGKGVNPEGLRNP
jgi:hypothetical protein